MQLEPLLVSRRQLGVILDLPLRTLARLESEQQIPGRVVIGERIVRYDLRAIKRWRDAGCPPAPRWERR